MLTLEIHDKTRAEQAAVDQELQDRQAQEAYDAADRDPILAEMQQSASWLDSMDSEDVVKDTAQAEQIEATLQTISAQMETVRLVPDSEDSFFEPLWEPNPGCPDWNIVLKRIIQLTTLLEGGTFEQANRMSGLNDRGHVIALGSQQLCTRKVMARAILSHPVSVQQQHVSVVEA